MLAAGAPPPSFSPPATNPATPSSVRREHRYECIHNWGELPKHLRWETTHGVCVDGAGLIYIKQQGHGGRPAQDTVVVFDPKGKFVRSFGKIYHTGGHGIDVRKEGKEEFLYLTNSWRRTFSKTTLKGEIVWTKCFPDGPNKYTTPEQFSPTNVAFAPDGGFYIGDGAAAPHLIHQYDKDAKWLRTWGGSGDKPGLMRTPHGIWLDDRAGRKPSLVVADRANARLQYFTLDGKHAGFVTGLLFPAHFDIRGEVLLVPDLHARVSLFDKDNKPIVHLGDDAEWRKKALDGFKVRQKPETCPAGRFIHPHDACFDRDGNIFVVEWVQTGRVSLLKRLA